MNQMLAALFEKLLRAWSPENAFSLAGLIARNFARNSRIRKKTFKMLKALGRLFDLLTTIRFVIMLMGMLGWLYVASMVAQGRTKDLRVRAIELVTGLRSATEKANDILQDDESWNWINQKSDLGQTDGDGASSSNWEY